MTRPRQDLIEGLRHLGYEAWMAAASAAARLKLAGDTEADPTGPVVGVVDNALLESTLLHARALIDFFVFGGKYDSDIRPTDFAPKWTPTPTEAAERAKAAYPVLNKHLSHLTWARVNQGQQAWDPTTVIVDLMQIAENWCNHLDQHDAELAQVFRPRIFDAYQVFVIPLSQAVPVPRTEQ